MDGTLSAVFLRRIQMNANACSTPLLPCSILDLHLHEPSQANRNGKELSRLSGRLSCSGMLALLRLPDPPLHFMLKIALASQ